MNFLEIAQARQSCRAYDETREVEAEKLEAILEAARIAPSACNGQPYHITVCRGQASQEVALACRGMGLNKFAVQADNFAVFRNVADGNTAGIPDSAFGNAAHSGQDNTGGNILFFADFFDGQHQIVTTAQPDTVTFHLAHGG